MASALFFINPQDGLPYLLAIVLLFCAGRASSVAYIASQNLPQRYGCPGILCYDILGLPDVRLQVVKLTDLLYYLIIIVWLFSSCSVNWIKS